MLRILLIQQRNLSRLTQRWMSTTADQSPSMEKKELKQLDQLAHAKLFEDMPGLKGLPFIGTYLDYTFLRGFKLPYLYNIWKKRHEQYGDIYKERMIGSRTIVFCRSREDTEAMFRADTRTPRRLKLDAIAYIKKIINVPESLLNLKGEEWYRHRRVINVPMLTNKMVWKYFKEQHGVAKDLTAYILSHLNTQGEVDDFNTVLSRWAFEMSGTFLLNTRMGLLTDSAEQSMEEIYDGAEKMMVFLANSRSSLKIWRFVKTKESKELERSMLRSATLINELLQKRVESGGVDGTALGEILNAEDLSKGEKLSMIYDILLASIETTSKSAALIMYCLTLNSEAQEKLRNEILEMPKELNGRALGNMPYMNAFIKEAARLFPLSHSFGRVYYKDIVLSGYRIPAGTIVVNTSNSTQHTNPDYFSQPDKFIPERWMKKDDGTGRFNLSGPFGMGARACPGRRFAMQEIRLLLVEVLKTFKVEYHHRPIVSIYRGTGTPSEPPQFKFVPLDE